MTSSPLQDFAANQPKPTTAAAPKRCLGCGHDFHPAGKCGAHRCMCERNTAITLELEASETTIARLEADNARLAALAKQNEKRAVDAEFRVSNMRLGEHDYQGRVERNTHDVLAALETTAEAQLGELRHILKALQTNAESRNVVEIDSNGSAGRIKIKVRCVGETLEDAHLDALEQFAQAMAEVEAGVEAGWGATVAMLQAKKDAAAA